MWESGLLSSCQLSHASAICTTSGALALRRLSLVWGRHDQCSFRGSYIAARNIITSTFTSTSNRDTLYANRLTLCHSSLTRTTTYHGDMNTNIHH